MKEDFKRHSQVFISIIYYSNPVNISQISYDEAKEIVKKIEIVEPFNFPKDNDRSTWTQHRETQ